MLFDSHSHLHDKKFSEDTPAVLDRARAAGVVGILTLGDTLGASRAAIALAEEYPMVIAAAGIHPSNARSWDAIAEKELELLLAHPRVALLGEIGLDLYWDKTPEFYAIQEKAFRAQLRMARRLGFPVSIHSRESDDQVLAILEEEHGAEIGGVLHCFNGTWEHARRGLEMGFYLGVGGSSTYPKSAELREVLQRVGIAHLLLETDAPYLPPQPCRGKRNESAMMSHTALALAQLLHLSVAKVAEVTYENTLRAFRISHDWKVNPKPAAVAIRGT